MATGEVAVKVKRRSERGNWLVVRYRHGKIVWCTWVRTWAGVQMSKRNKEKYIRNGDGSVVILNIERMVDFAVCEGANEIHELYKLFEK